MSADPGTPSTRMAWRFLGKKSNGDTVITILEGSTWFRARDEFRRLFGSDPSEWLRLADPANSRPSTRKTG